MRPGIKRIEIADFRAYPKTMPALLEVDGCNLLVFGGNGAGKSSIYRALRDLFSLTPRDIGERRNVFTPIEAAEPRVVVELTDGTVFRWDASGHPTTEVAAVARRAAFLSHTRLREFNTGDTSDTPANLFDMAVGFMLADFEATLEGGGKRTVGELWADVDAAMAKRITKSGKQERGTTFRREVERALAAFRDGMNQAIDALEARGRELLRSLLDVLAPDALELVGFTFPPISLRDDFTLSDRLLTLRVRVRNHAPPAAQNFLNEGRQTALAIAIHFAARLICVPPGEGALKLLVLDDLLISLDQSHRRPVLDVLATLFSSWRIVLLTHDRFWFEQAREQLLLKPWKAVELYEAHDADGLLTPMIRPVEGDLIAETLKQARLFRQERHPAAAANYARAALELALRRYCRTHQLAVPYTDEPQKISLEDLRGRAETKAKETAKKVAGKWCVEATACVAALAGLEHHRRLILNPLSHNTVEPVEPADVDKAIDAVAVLVGALSAHKREAR